MTLDEALNKLLEDDENEEACKVIARGLFDKIKMEYEYYLRGSVHNELSFLFSRIQKEKNVPKINERAKLCR